MPDIWTLGQWMDDIVLTLNHLASLGLVPKWVARKLQAMWEEVRGLV